MSRGTLTEADWAAMRQRYEVQGHSIRAIARDAGCDESLIRQRKKKEGWEQDPAALERIQERAAVRTLTAALRSETPHSADRGVLRSEDRETLREEVIEQAADVIAEANRRALAKADHLDATFSTLSALVADLLSRPAESDEAAMRRKAEAMQTLLAGRSDTVTGAILALAKLAESIQGQRRKALGADDRPKQVQLTGAGGGPIQTENSGAVAVAVDYGKLSTEELTRLMEAASILEGKRERPPIPMPPGDPEPAAP